MLDRIDTIQMDIRPDVTYLKTDTLKCPICGSNVPQEDIKTGRGRLDAGVLTDDLHRNYVPSEEYGEVFPIIYMVLTCPNCYYSTFKKDFLKLSSVSMANISTPLAKLRRKMSLEYLFSEIPDFTKQKDLLSGLATYISALATYNQCDTKDAPTIRMAVCSLRSSWIINHIKEHAVEGESIDILLKIFYRKTLFLYDLAYEYSINGIEDMANINEYGPDYDKDYGYDGVIYLCAWLTLHYGDKSNALEREACLKKGRGNLSKVFGFGKSTKAKPSILLNVARKLFDQIEEEMKNYL